MESIISTINSVSNSPKEEKLSEFEQTMRSCCDPYGNDNPIEIFRNEIAPVLEKYKISKKELNKITKHISEMCRLSYNNGASNESFCTSDY